VGRLDYVVYKAGSFLVCKRCFKRVRAPIWYWILLAPLWLGPPVAILECGVDNRVGFYAVAFMGMFLASLIMAYVMPVRKHHSSC